MGSGDGVDVSITLLTRNAGPLLARVLRAIRSQETQRSVEIVAVDSGSSDGTLAVLAQFDVNVAQISADSFDFGLTRDHVFEMARGEIVIALSQDAVPAHPGWLEALVAPLAEPSVAASCGRSIPDPERDMPQFIWERNGYFYFTREMRAFFKKYGRGLSNANAAIRRSVWERLRFGRQPIGEDFRFQTKLNAEGLQIAFPDGAETLHHHAYTLPSLYKRCRNEGLGLRTLGCAYSELDLVRDLLRFDVHRAWLRESLHGNLRWPSDWVFPVLRPCAVYAGSRFARGFLR
ncbi:MAG TPA: glycosyltransferase family 2 protein [Candidatus Hydrogenedentes bacterium]|nr:glycosyltransferase family 2 protein [Candidatus Hydrogenedentota bacterium]